MADVVPPEVRSRMMSGIRGRNTQPELAVRRGLHGLGFRFRLHVRGLPGKPDIVLPKYRAVILVHGCFWHGHDCPLFKWPSTRPDFWRAKITRNREVDARNRRELGDLGWRVMEIRECALKGPGRRDPAVVLERAARWLRGDRRRGRIEGIRPRATV